MKMTRKYPIVIVKEKKDFWAYIPDIPGVYGRGKTARQAKEDIRKALALYIEDCLADGDSVPKSSAKVVDVDTLSIAVGE
ncbi:MAG TPA: type II toxin-antitoxin system HicB family antitoxin [Candidatus Binatia bacterium]|nr:type II toxin-antitoxin system HicB family antitoxin [Candidatus Binatia bacterium]